LRLLIRGELSFKELPTGGLYSCDARAENSMPERRKFQRTKVQKAAKIIAARREPLLDCVVLNLSVGGVWLTRIRRLIDVGQVKVRL